MDRDPKPGPVIDSDGTRHYGDADTADEGTKGRAGDDADSNAGGDMDANTITITSSDGDRETYSDCHIYTCGTGSSSIAYTVDRSNPLTFGYPDTAHSYRSAPANPDADPGASGADSDAGSDDDADDDADAYGWDAQRDA